MAGSGGKRRNFDQSRASKGSLVVRAGALRDGVTLYAPVLR
jgi:hypothetical protein